MYLSFLCILWPAYHGTAACPYRSAPPASQIGGIAGVVHLGDQSCLNESTLAGSNRAGGARACP
jgi:hypothetical protein